MRTPLSDAASLVALRRDLHRHPELRFAEQRTASVLADRMTAAGFQVQTGVAGTGVVASLGDRSARPHVLLRADMDALPVVDLKTADYRSTMPGVTHACGHDVHMAAVVGAAERLAADGLPAGRLTIVFQPAEEIPFGEPSGGRALVETGVLEDPPVDAALSLHCWPSLPVGTIGLDPSVAMGAKDAFRVRIVGRGAHAATPSRGRDAILAASLMVVALHHLLAREINTDEQAALNVGTIRGGASQSVVPSSVEITGTLRTLDAAVRARLRGAIERTVNGTSAMSGTTVDLEWANEMPPVVNDPRLVRRARRVLADVPSVQAVRMLDHPPMTVDDFAVYAERVPALYMKLGICAGEDPDACPSLHNGRFDVDERAIAIAADAMASLARDLLADPMEEA